MKSNLRIYMAFNGFKNLKEVNTLANVSWEITKRLDENKDIEKIRLHNILKVAKVLNVKFEDLVIFDRRFEPYQFKRSPDKKTNIKTLMAINNLDTQDELIRMSGVSWSVVTKLYKGDYENIQLSNLIKVCLALKCNINDLINFEYDYEIKEFHF